MAYKKLSIEDICNNLYNDYHEYETIYHPIRMWIYEKEDFLEPSSSSSSSSLIININKAIIEAPLSECLTSPIKYIRDYRIAFEEYKNESQK